MAGKKKYADFFAEAEKKMFWESMERARQKAEKAILNLRLADLRKEAGIKQTAPHERMEKARSRSSG